MHRDTSLQAAWAKHSGAEMTTAVLCASHTPLMYDGSVSLEIDQSVRKGFSRLANHVRNFTPDLVIQFSPDHFNGFFYDLMPPFCVGTAAVSIGDWGTQPGPIDVPQQFATDLAAALLAQDIDIALSHRMTIDHGFTQIWEAMFDDQYQIPIVPIFVNSIADPLPSYRRARMLGEAVGQFAAANGNRVLFVASGGLSHDPPTPEFATAPEDVRARLIDGRNPTFEMRGAREDRVRAAGVAAAAGSGPCLPLNSEWDRQVIALLSAGDISVFDAFDTTEVRRVAGRGGNEILSWIAAFAAQSVAGPIDARLEYYQPIPSWIAGMGMLFGTTAAARR